MGSTLAKVSYRGYRTGEKWEVVVERRGQPLRLLDVPRRKEEWAQRILADYLGDEGRAENLHGDFAALTIRRFTDDWELSENEIDNALMEIEILRLLWRVALARG